MSEQAKRDQNFVTSMLFVGSDGGTYNAQGDKTTGRLYVDLPSSSGTVTDVSVVTANGFAGTVADSTTTPAITLDTTVTGILKGDGTAISAGTAGDVDSILPTQTGNSGKYLTTDGTNSSWASVAGGGITIGTTTITSGTDTRILYDNSGVVGEYTITGTGTVVAMATSPSFTTPSLGAASATSINKVAITAPTTSATLTIADGKTLTVSNTLTFTGTDSSSVAFGAGGTVLYTTSTVPLTIGSTTIASGTTTRILYDNAGTLGEYTITGTGTVVAMQTSPSFTTPLLGTPTSGTLTNCTGLPAASVVAGTFGTGAYTMDTSLTVPQIFNTPHAATVSSNAATITRAYRINNFTNSSAATMAITLSTSGALDGDLLMVRIYDFSAVAQTIGWTNTEDSTVTAPTTSNGSTTLPLTVGFQYNGSTSKWRCIAKA